MLGRFHFSEDGFEEAVGSDEEGGSLGAHVGFSVHALFDPDLVGLDDFLVFVGEEGEGELMFLDEFLVALCGVDADAEDDGLAFEFGPVVAEGAGLGGATGCVVLGVEVEDDVLAGEI